VYGKRTTLYDKHVFNKEKPAFIEKVSFIDNEVYNKSERILEKSYEKFD
jgi:hypothetical protein